MTALSSGIDDFVAQSNATPKEASGVIEEKQVADLLIQMGKM